MIRVLVVDDSATVRSWLCGVIGRHPEFKVVGEATDGKGALKAVEAFTPDVVVLDLNMPVMDGVAATNELLKRTPVPIVILTAETSAAPGNALHAAIEAGALKVVMKPTRELSGPRWERDFIQTLRAATKIPILRRRQSAPPAKAPAKGTKARVIAIGASTGGPQAVAEILSTLPILPVPVIVVVHASDGLPERLVEWYSKISKMPVQLAGPESTATSLNGKVVIAPNDRHLVYRSGVLKLELGAPRHFCRPSIDVLFDSLAELKAGAFCALLTGMGRDGAEGLLSVRRAGGTTVVQDEASSVVYGMPKAAIDLSAQQAILSIPAIVQMIREHASEGRDHESS